MAVLVAVSYVFDRRQHHTGYVRIQYAINERHIALPCDTLLKVYTIAHFVTLKTV